MSVVVAAGTGTTTKNWGGKFLGYSIKAPSNTVSYALEVFDEDGFGVCGRRTYVGSYTVKDEGMSYRQTTVTITSASEAGTFEVRFFMVT